MAEQFQFDKTPLQLAMEDIVGDADTEVSLAPQESIFNAGGMQEYKDQTKMVLSLKVDPIMADAIAEVFAEKNISQESRVVLGTMEEVINPSGYYEGRLVISLGDIGTSSEQRVAAIIKYAPLLKEEIGQRVQLKQEKKDEADRYKDKVDRSEHVLSKVFKTFMPSNSPIELSFCEKDSRAMARIEVSMDAYQRIPTENGGPLHAVAEKLKAYVNDEGVRIHSFEVEPKDIVTRRKVSLSAVLEKLGGKQLDWQTAEAQRISEAKHIGLILVDLGEAKELEDGALCFEVENIIPLKEALENADKEISSAVAESKALGGRL